MWVLREVPEVDQVISHSELFTLLRDAPFYLIGCSHMIKKVL